MGEVGGYLCSHVGLLVSGVNVACWVFDSGAYMVEGGLQLALLCFLIYGVRFWFLLLVVLMPDGFEVVFWVTRIW